MNFTFQRTALAEVYCNNLEGQGIANATSGLFLAGPRRVGKSTFLIEDLIPEALKRDWIPIYVDLWSNKLTDPSLLIIEAIKASINTQKSKLSKLSKHLSLQKINLLKLVEFDFTKPGLPDHMTLVDLLISLLNLSDKKILLIIDEAQHALTTPNGINTMFSLKSARDQINLSRHAPKLMLVLTGSNRDKLAQLVIKKDQPFFGSEVTAFPLLGRDYTDFFTDMVNKSLAKNNQFDKNSMWEAFYLIGHRPEILRQIVGEVAINHDAPSFSDLLKHNAILWHSQIWQNFDNDFNALTPLQKIILACLIEQGRSWSPFADESMRFYKKAIKQTNLSISTVQTAIQALREKGFIWQSNRGGYALEDESFAEWYKHSYLNK